MIAIATAYRSYSRQGFRRALAWQLAKEVGITTFEKASTVLTMLLMTVFLVYAGSAYIWAADNARHVAEQKLDQTEKIVASLLNGGVIVDGNLYAVQVDNLKDRAFAQDDTPSNDAAYTDENGELKGSKPPTFLATLVAFYDFLSSDYGLIRSAYASSDPPNASR